MKFYIKFINIKLIFIIKFKKNNFIFFFEFQGISKLRLKSIDLLLLIMSFKSKRLLQKYLLARECLI